MGSLITKCSLQNNVSPLVQSHYPKLVQVSVILLIRNAPQSHLTTANNDENCCKMSNSRLLFLALHLEATCYSTDICGPTAFNINKHITSTCAVIKPIPTGKLNTITTTKRRLLFRMHCASD